MVVCTRTDLEVCDAPPQNRLMEGDGDRFRGIGVALGPLAQAALKFIGVGLGGAR